jgi:hypothetical protein
LSGNGGLLSGMSDRAVARHYRDLDPAERFRLALEAEAREDARELERLVQTCPRLLYKMDDAAFTDRVDAARTMAVAVALDLGPRLVKLRMLEAVRETLPRAVALGVDVGVEEPGELTPEAIEGIVGETLGRAFDRVEEHLRSEAAAVLEGFARVCRDEMRVEPETVLRATLGPLYLGMLAIDRLAGAKPDTAQLKDWHAMFARKWAQRVCG